MLRVKGSKPGEPGFQTINPLHIDKSLQSQLGRRYVAKILFNGVLKLVCSNRKQYEEAKSMGKVVTKVEKIDITPSGFQGVKGVEQGCSHFFSMRATYKMTKSK